MTRKEYDVVVVGAGMVGVCSALWLQREGLNVALVDRKEPGSGASSGNAGVFADYISHTMNDPGLLTQLPNKLLGMDHPVSLRFPHVMKMIPWFFQFTKNCLPENAQHNAHAIEYICRFAKAGFVPLIEHVKAGDLINKRGVIQLFNDKKSFAGVEADIQLLSRKSYKSRAISASDLHDLEPNVKLPFYKGVLYEDAWNIVNPLQLVQRFAEKFTSDGGSFEMLDVMQISRRPEGRFEVVGDRMTLGAKQVVLAAGAFSKKINGDFGIGQMPLDTERGYHVMFDEQSDLISRPVCWANVGLFISPINGGVRAAGTIEFGGLSEKKNRWRLNQIESCAKRMLPQLEERNSDLDWIGFRPTLPDCLPVIGRDRKVPDIIHAFGHQHIGMTLGGITGKLVSEIATNKPLSLNINDFRPDRF